MGGNRSCSNLVSTSFHSFHYSPPIFTNFASRLVDFGKLRVDCLALFYDEFLLASKIRDGKRKGGKGGKEGGMDGREVRKEGGRDGGKEGEKEE